MALFYPVIDDQRDVIGANFQSEKFVGFVKNHSWWFCFCGFDKKFHLHPLRTRRYSDPTITLQQRLFILSLYSSGQNYVE